MATTTPSSTPTIPPELHRLRDFVGDLGATLERHQGEDAIVEQGSELLAELVAHDDWLPDAYAVPDPDRYQQYLLHCDSQRRFSVVSFVWGPGQATPIHDHTTWGLIGVLRGRESATRYAWSDDVLVADGSAELLTTGEVDAVSPHIGDIHQVTNAHDDRPSISIHVYGADIGAVHRHVYRPDGSTASFVSGYSNTTLPNVWGE